MAKTNQANKGNQQAKSSSKSKSSAKKEVKKRRGGLLSVLIILIGVHAIFATYLGYTSLKQYYDGQRSWILATIRLAVPGRHRSSCRNVAVEAMGNLSLYNLYRCPDCYFHRPDRIRLG